MIAQLLETYDGADMRALRQDILDSPVRVCLERAEAFTRVFRENEAAPWIVNKALALREHLRTMTLYLRPGDRIAGAISGAPGAMPLMVELGIAENPIYLNENPHRAGYLKGQVPQDIHAYWRDRNLWGRYRGYMRAVMGVDLPFADQAQYKFISNQGHLSPSYRELLDLGLGGMIERVLRRREGESAPEKLEFLAAAEHALRGVAHWAERHAAFLGEEARRAGAERAADLREMSRICAKIAHEPPATFSEAMQLIWLVHQAIHIEGHGYSCTPDRLDQILYPYYIEDRQAGRLDDAEALRLCENFILKQRDNTFWGIEHGLTQGLVVSGSTPEGEDQTNELSWLFIAATGRMSVPEPLVWVRWHPNIDRSFFDFCLQNLAGSTCFPLMMSDTAVPAMYMELGVERADAFNYVPVGCNELGIPGQTYFNPGAHANYLGSLELALTQGKGYNGKRQGEAATPPLAELDSFEKLIDACSVHLRNSIERSYNAELATLMAQMRWGVTPLTSCFFDGCIENARDMAQGTKYNIRTCGGTAFANMIDCLAAIRDVVYEKREASLQEVIDAVKANFEGHEELRRKLLAAPKHGNDDPRLDGVIRAVERMRDEPMKEICRDPRDGTPFGNGHVVRSGAILGGLRTGATPDGRKAGQPLAGSVAASHAAERSGPTALLNSILKTNAAKSWQCGYNVNMRMARSMLANPENRAKTQAMLEAFFLGGGQEMQINCVDSATLRAAREHPEAYRDLVVRVSGFSAFFVDLHPAIQADIVEREEHAL